MNAKGLIITFFAVINLVFCALVSLWALIYFLFSHTGPLDWKDFATACVVALCLGSGIFALAKKSIIILLMCFSVWGMVILIVNYYGVFAFKVAEEIDCHQLRQIPNCVEYSSGTIVCGDGKEYLYACQGVPK